MPFTRLPCLIVKELVKQAEDLCNLFPSGSGPTTEHSLSALIQGTGKPDFNNYSVEFGAYVQVYDGTYNTLKSRTFGAIALHRTGNADNSFAFMSLVTRECITCAPGFWTELPITDAAIARVHAIATEEGQPPLQHKNLVVEWRPDHEVDPDEYDKDYHPGTTEHDKDESLVYDNDEASVVFTTQTDNQANTNTVDPQGSVSDLGTDHVDMDINTEATDTEEVDAHIPTDDNDSLNGVPDDGNLEVPVETDAGVDEGTDNPSNMTHSVDQSHLIPQTTEPSAVNQDPSGNTQAPVASYSLRANRTQDYSHRLSHAMDDPISTKAYEPTNGGTQLVQVASEGADKGAPHPFPGMLFQQMSACAGYKRFGDAACDATCREFKQLVDKDVFTPVRPEHLTQKEREQSLRVVNLIKHKRDGTIKGCTCADRRKQRDLYDKSQTVSPTVSSDALVLTIMIDAKEGRDVATADVAGAYLNADMDDLVVMRLVSEDVALMCEVESSFRHHVVQEGKNDVLYLRLDKALYGCVRSALLWYNLFSKTLKDMGFVLNGYDPCVANAVFNKKQCTITWYVDDMKLSHVHPEVVTHVIKNIEQHFGKMTVRRGRVHEFLGMVIDYSDPGVAHILMKSYLLKEAIRESQLGITCSATTPAQKNLFDVDPALTSLDPRNAILFRSIVCKLLYVARYGRPDLLTAVCFLATCVSQPVEQDERKLQRLLEYIHGSIDLTLTISATDLQHLATHLG